MQIFDGNILMEGHYLSPYTCKHCIVFKQFDGLNFDGLAESIKNVKISPIKTLRYTASDSAIHHDEARPNLLTYIGSHLLIYQIIYIARR